MDEWFEVEVKTDHGWGVVCLPPVSVHGGVVTVEIAKRYASEDEARDHGSRYGLPLIIYRCTENHRSAVEIP